MLPIKYHFATRLNSFRSGEPRPDAATAIRLVGKVTGISAVELNFPQHFPTGAPETLLAVAADAGLVVTALNLRFDGPDFAAGSFTHPVAENRQKAIQTAFDAVDFAARHDIGHVILWMGPDGFDYPFQVDYRQVWDYEIEGFRRVAARQSGVRVSVENKPSDPRRTSTVRSMADGLLAAHEVDLPNFGVTLDYCHLLMAGESPAAAAAMALRAKKLFGVHLNDGYGPADDGLMVGSVGLWHTIELLLELQKGNYEGTIYFDTFPVNVDAGAECAANVRTMGRLLALIEALPLDELRKIQDAQDAVAATALMHDLVLGRFDG
jgi:xylose isomerase